MKDVYFWRQLFVVSAALLYSVSIGFMLGYPAVLTQAILSSNSSDITTSKAHASWITASNGLAGIVGSFIISPVLQLWGRKAAHLLITLWLLLGWIIFPLSQSIIHLYAARMVQGLSIGGIYITSMIVGEYLHPVRRGYCITLKKVMVAVGTLCCHAMQPFWTWRQIPVFAAVITALSIIVTLYWPESPSFLALKGNFSECERVFFWLNGDSAESRAHLKSLLDSQVERHQAHTKKESNAIGRFFKDFLKKDLLKSLFIVSVLSLAVDLCGKYYFIAYVVEIMTKLLQNETSALYFTIGSDLLTVVALSSSTIIISYINRRVLLYSTGILSVTLMFIISLLVYLINTYKLPSGLLWLTALILIFQYFTVNIGLIPVSFALVGEIFPLESKGIAGCLSGAVFTAFYALTLKLTPFLMEQTGLTGTYGIYGVCLGVCLLMVYKVLPETKDKTLQQIEIELKGEIKNVTEGEQLLNI